MTTIQWTKRDETIAQVSIRVFDRKRGRDLRESKEETYEWKDERKEG
jgi:hypothetical protein